ncbi:MAG TPA: tellurite resistance TerB family protein [Roseomonas sp.]|jgi:uncharacterized membrane protein YebE (DUF533 family)
MIDAKSLLERFLGQGAAGAAGGIAESGRQAMSGGGLGGLAGGAAAGGVIALLLGSKKARKFAGGALGYGGAAVLGALAHRAYQNWQQGRAPADAPLAAPQEVSQVTPVFLPSAAPAADGKPFELALMRAMVGAARADGHVDAEERNRIVGQVERLGFDAEAKACLFDLIDQPVSVTDIAAAAATPEQGAELYLAARLSIDPDQAAERAWLDTLAHRLRLEPGLAAHLDRQAEAVPAA